MKRKSTLTPPYYQKQLHASFAGDYSQGQDRWTDEKASFAALNYLIENVFNPSKRYRILDLGGGTGAKARILNQLGHQVTVIDIVSLETEWITNKVQGIVVNFLDYRPDNQVDAIIDLGCLHHQHPEHVDEYLRNVARCLKPGGLYCAALFHDSPDETCRLFDAEKGRYSKDYDTESIQRISKRHNIDLSGHTIIPRQKHLGKYLLCWGKRCT